MEDSLNRPSSTISTRQYVVPRDDNHGKGGYAKFQHVRDMKRNLYVNRDDHSWNNSGRESQRRKLASPNSVIGVFGHSEDTTESDLEELFSPFGEVKRVNLIFDRETGRFKCFAFVYFESVQSASRALKEKNETELRGSLIRIDFSATVRTHFSRDGPLGDGGYYNCESSYPHRQSSRPSHAGDHHHYPTTNPHSRYAYHDYPHASFNEYIDRLPPKERHDDSFQRERPNGVFLQEKRCNNSIRRERYQDFSWREHNSRPEERSAYDHHRYQFRPIHYNEPKEHPHMIQNHPKNGSLMQHSRIPHHRGHFSLREQTTEVFAPFTSLPYGNSRGSPYSY